MSRKSGDTARGEGVRRREEGGVAAGIEIAMLRAAHAVQIRIMRGAE